MISKFFRILGGLIVILLVGIGVYSLTLPNAYDMACAAFQKAAASGADPSTKSATLAHEIAFGINRLMILKFYSSETTVSFVRAFQEVGSAPPEKKYDLLVQSAKQAGLSQWSCPGLDSVFRQQ